MQQAMKAALLAERLAPMLDTAESVLARPVHGLPLAQQGDMLRAKVAAGKQRDAIRALLYPED